MPTFPDGDNAGQPLPNEWMYAQQYDNVMDELGFDFDEVRAARWPRYRPSMIVGPAVSMSVWAADIMTYNRQVRAILGHNSELVFQARAWFTLKSNEGDYAELIQVKDKNDLASDIAQLDFNSVKTAHTVYLTTYQYNQEYGVEWGDLSLVQIEQQNIFGSEPDDGGKATGEDAQGTTA